MLFSTCFVKIAEEMIKIFHDESVFLFFVHKPAKYYLEMFTLFAELVIFAACPWFLQTFSSRSSKVIDNKRVT